MKTKPVKLTWYCVGVIQMLIGLAFIIAACIIDRTNGFCAVVGGCFALVGMLVMDKSETVNTEHCCQHQHPE